MHVAEPRYQSCWLPRVSCFGQHDNGTIQTLPLRDCVSYQFYEKGEGILRFMHAGQHDSPTYGLSRPTEASDVASVETLLRHKGRELFIRYSMPFRKGLPFRDVNKRT